MKSTLPFAVASALALAVCAAPAVAATPIGASDHATHAQQKDIVAAAVAAPSLSTLVTAVKAADLVGTLQGAGPFTVFAPTNGAFGKLPAGTVDALLKPEAKAALTGVLTYHVVAGNVDAATLAKQIQAGGGTATLTTVQGGTLTAKADGMGGIVLTDAKGGTAKVVAADMRQSNGVVHVIDSVLMPQ